MVVVKSTEEEGVCYVETKNLDGETNLKNKCVPKELWNQFDHPREGIQSFEAVLNFDGPNNLIYKFDGRIETTRKGSRQLLRQDSVESSEDEMIIPLSNDNILLRGMSLRNTEMVIGIVVYTGHETKIQMNTVKGEYKFSKMMNLTNQAIFYIFMLQIFFSLTGAIVCATWTIDNQDVRYMAMNKGEYGKQDLGFIVATMAGSWILIFCNFVPISLLVTLEMVKFFQGSFMDLDVDMFDESQDYNCRAQSTNINEELGQVEYIFSDKTGTLTCNIMEFKKFSTSSAAYSVHEDENQPKVQSVDEPIDFVNNPMGLIFKNLYNAYQFDV